MVDPDLVDIGLPREKMDKGNTGEGKALSGWSVMTVLRSQVIAELPEGAPQAQVIDPPHGRYIPTRWATSYTPWTEGSR